MKRCLNVLLMAVLSTGIMTSCGSISVGYPGTSDAASQGKTYAHKTDLKATCDLTKVAFVGDGNEIVVDDGSGERVVYPGGAFDLDSVQWSPDGRYVSFYRVGYNYRRELIICDTETGSVMESGQAVYGDRLNYLQRYIWSADSSKAIFYSDTGGGFYDVLAEKAVEIAPVYKRFYTASFSPDGSRILYCEGDPEAGTYILKIYDPDTGTRQDIYRYEGFNSLTTTPPLWLSDGEILVFETLSGKVYKIEASTGKTQEYPMDSRMSGTLRISPNRSFLAYQTPEGVVVKNIFSGTETLIKTKDGSKGYPVWGYDNQEVIICCETAIWIYDLDGVQMRDEIKLKTYRPGGERRFSDPVFTKGGLWYEGCEE